MSSNPESKRTNGSGKSISFEHEVLPRLEEGNIKEIEPTKKDAHPAMVPYRALLRQAFHLCGTTVPPLQPPLNNWLTTGSSLSISCRYADKWDIMAMILGTLGSLANGKAT